VIVEFVPNRLAATPNLPTPASGVVLTEITFEFPASPGLPLLQPVGFAPGTGRVERGQSTTLISTSSVLLLLPTLARPHRQWWLAALEGLRGDGLPSPM